MALSIGNSVMIGIVTHKSFIFQSYSSIFKATFSNRGFFYIFSCSMLTIQDSVP